MPTQLPKSFDTAEIEKLAAEYWEKHRLFHAEPSDPGKPFAMVIPPPNVTGALHLGHALNNTLQDIVIRWRRMCGDNAVWIPGTDHAGIATQAVVEKRLLKEGKRRTDFTRDEFVAMVQAWKDEYEARIIAQLKAMGCSCDWDRLAFTMDEPRAKAVREAFFRLFKDGLIYRGKRLVNWDPVSQTALADDEVENEEVDGFFYYLRYPLEDKSGHVTVATTRPETMLGDTAVAINPRDPRAAELRGKRVHLPIVNRIVPIIEDEYVVLPIALGGHPDDPKAQFATGFLKVTPAHDPNDYDIGQRHNLPLINVMAPDASISEKHGWPADDFARGDAFLREQLLGKSREEARTLIVHWFRDNGLLEDTKPYRHSVGHSYRSHVPIEPYLSDQWYLRVTDERLAKRANSVLVSDQRNTGAPPVPSEAEHGRGARATVTFHPARYARTYETWHDNIRDWCISRQLWWGHRIPVWTGPRWPDVPAGLTRALMQKPDEVAVSQAESATFVCLRRNDAELETALRAAGFQHDPDVLDTWFSSALWPLSTLGWPDESAIGSSQSALNTWNPTQLLSTAREIITLWVSRMVMMNLYMLDRVPFTNVYVHAVVQDGEGRKMSKSLGNGVDPLDIIHTHGADAMRYTLASMATNTQDVRMPVEPDPATGKNTSAKFDIGRAFCLKLWNAARFVLMQLEQKETERRRDEETKCADANSSTSSLSLSVSSSLSVNELKWTMADRWIVSRFNRAAGEAHEALSTYRFDQYAKTIYDFFWRDFCDWYVEAAKPQMKNPEQREQTANVLASVLDGALRLMHPVIPFVTEVLWWKLNEVCPQRGIPGRLDCLSHRKAMGINALMRAPFPVDSKNYSEAAEHIFPKIQELIVAIRNARNEYKVEARKAVNVSIKTTENAARQIELLKPAIELLATCKLDTVGPSVAMPSNSVRVQVAETELYLEGLTDPQADAQRVARQRDELTKKIATLRARLSNEGYIAKAPAKLVEETRAQLAQAETELAKLQ